MPVSSAYSVRSAPSCSLARADATGGEGLIAASVERGLIVVALRRPGVRPGLAQRVALALAAGDVEALLVVNKLDLLTAEERAGLADEMRAFATTQLARAAG